MVSIPQEIPHELRFTRAFIGYANQLDDDHISPESRIVAYHCRIFAAEVAMPYATSEDSKHFLTELMNELAPEREALSSISTEEAHVLCRDFANKIFDQADMEDKLGSASRSTADLFNSAAICYETLRQFYDNDTDKEEKEEDRKWAYCIRRAGEIFRTVVKNTPSKYNGRINDDNDDVAESTCPPELKQISTFLGYADKLDGDDSAESRIVAFRCRVWAAQQGAECVSSEEGKKFLLDLMNQIESEGEALSTISPDESHILCRDFANQIFQRVIVEDEAAEVSAEIADTFETASVFYEILQQFHDDDINNRQMCKEQVEGERKRAYSLRRSLEISKAIEKKDEEIVEKESVQAEVKNSPILKGGSVDTLLEVSPSVDATNEGRKFCRDSDAEVNDTVIATVVDEYSHYDDASTISACSSKSKSTKQEKLEEIKKIIGTAESELKTAKDAGADVLESNSSFTHRSEKSKEVINDNGIDNNDQEIDYNDGDENDGNVVDTVGRENLHNSDFCTSVPLFKKEACVSRNKNEDDAKDAGVIEEIPLDMIDWVSSSSSENETRKGVENDIVHNFADERENKMKGKDSPCESIPSDGLNSMVNDSCSTEFLGCSEDFYDATSYASEEDEAPTGNVPRDRNQEIEMHQIPLDAKEEYQHYDHIQSTKHKANTGGLPVTPTAPPITEDASDPERTILRDCFLDPITQEIMVDPVICEDGFTYDRQVIETHFQCALTSPMTGEIVTGLLLPNRNIEQQIVELFEEMNPGVAEEDRDKWHKRRELKLESDHNRAKGESNVQEHHEGPQTDIAIPTQPKYVPPAEQVRVDRSVTSGSGILSENDLGLSVSLCNDHQKCSLFYASSVGVGNVPRCMVACCAKCLDGDFSWCARCGRLVCSSCLEFHVTEFGGRSPTHLHSICCECVTQIIDVMGHTNTDGQIRAFISNVRLRDYYKKLTHRAIQIQNHQIQRNMENQFGPGNLELEEEINRMEHTKDEIQAQTRGMEAQYQAPNNSDVFFNEGRNDSESIAEKEQICAKLTRQYNELLERGCPEHDEEAQFTHVAAISDIADKLEKAELALLERKSRQSPNEKEATHLVDQDSGGSIEHWENACEELRRQYSNLRKRESEIPEDIHLQIAHIETISEVTSRLEDAERKLSVLQGKIGLSADNSSYALASDENIDFLSEEFSVDGRSVPELEEIYVILEREYRNLLSRLSSGDENSQFEHTQNLSIISDRLGAVQNRLAKEKESGNASNAIAQVDGSCLVDTEDLIILDAIGFRDCEWPLPLGLSFPTASMENQLERLRNDLAQNHVEFEQKCSNEYQRRRQVLTEQRNKLRNEIEQMRAGTKNIEGSENSE